jgi:uncharacterized protein YwqG
VPSTSEFAAAARTHLPAEMADAWLSLLRPAVRLVHADRSQTPVGQLGGTPYLPPDVEWPYWDGHGPLTYIAGLDCALLPTQETGLGLPPDGQLLFFYFDGQYDDGEALVLPSEPGSRAGSWVLHVEAGQRLVPRTTPDGIRAYPRVPLAAQVVVTAPSYDHPVLHDTFGAEFTQADQHPLRGREFCNVIWSSGQAPLHQLGGYAWPVQGDVEYEIAGPDAGQPRDWIPLAQFDSDDAADMMWGDTGMLYWLIRPDDLAARRFDRAAFTWQCC